MTKRRTGSWLVNERKAFFRLHPLCARCEAHRRVSVAVELDHIVPLFKGGEDKRSNKQGLCEPCHKEKTAEDMGHRVQTRVGDDGYPVD